MAWNPTITLEDLVFCIAEYSDLSSPAIARHHLLVAALAHAVAAQAGYPEEELRTVTLAGALHDIGAFSLKERIDLLAFEAEKPHEHSRIGANLLHGCSPLAGAASLILHHHVRHDEAPGGVFDGRAVDRGSFILHLADRVAVQIDPAREILGQVEGIMGTVAMREGTMFHPDAVHAFLAAAARESFWFEATDTEAEPLLRRRISAVESPLDAEDLLALAELLTRIVDYKSAFTATHSRGVAAVAESLARMARFDADRRLLIRFAGLLHDIGKLAVPSEIIEKQAGLSDVETNLMRSHAYQTWKAFARFRGLDEARAWASYHHEHLDGSGYPFRVSGDTLDAGCRILAVADIYTALTEDRPYRPGMEPQDAIDLIRDEVRRNHLDPWVVEVLAANVATVDRLRDQAQAEAAEEYRFLLSYRP